MIECLKYKRVGKGALIGFADIFVVKWCIEIRGISIFQKDGKRWINFPGREFTDPTGKKGFAPYLKFKERFHMDAFCNEVMRAVEKYAQDHQSIPVEDMIEEREEEFNVF